MDLLKGKQLSSREKVLIILVAVAAVAAMFYFFIYQSQIEKMASIKSQLNENNQKLTELKGFDGQLKNLEKEVDTLDDEIYDATKMWFPSLRQDVIIKDLEQKIQATNLSDASVTFKSSQQANIAEFKEDEELPTIAEALTLSFVTLMQDEQTETTDDTETGSESNLIDKVTDALAAPTPTPGPDNDETTTAFGAQAGAGKTQTKSGELDPEVQTKLNTLKSSLSGLTEAELKTQITQILANTSAKVDKMTIEVQFNNSSYKSIMDFVKKVEASSPNIYVSKIQFTDNTDAYVSELQGEVDNAESERVSIANLFRSQNNLSTFQPNTIVVEYKGVKKYNGSVTLDYFAVSKIHR
jgi:preprotein translocase subunit YajC